MYNICWKLLLLKSIKSTCFQQTFNNFVSFELFFTKLSGIHPYEKCIKYMFLWLLANLKEGVIYFIKQALPLNKSAGSVPVFIQKSFHSGSVFRRQSDAQWGENICHNLAKNQVNCQWGLDSFRWWKHLLPDLQCPGYPEKIEINR